MELSKSMKRETLLEQLHLLVGSTQNPTPLLPAGPGIQERNLHANMGVV